MRRRWAAMETVISVCVDLRSWSVARASRRWFWDWPWDWRPLCIASLRSWIDVRRVWAFLRAKRLGNGDATEGEGRVIPAWRAFRWDWR